MDDIKIFSVYYILKVLPVLILFQFLIYSHYIIFCYPTSNDIVNDFSSNIYKSSVKKLCFQLFIVYLFCGFRGYWHSYVFYKVICNIYPCII